MRFSSLRRKRLTFWVAFSLLHSCIEELFVIGVRWLGFLSWNNWFILLWPSLFFVKFWESYCFWSSQFALYIVTSNRSFKVSKFYWNLSFEIGQNWRVFVISFECITEKTDQRYTEDEINSDRNYILVELYLLFLVSLCFCFCTCFVIDKITTILLSFLFVLIILRDISSHAVEERFIFFIGFDLCIRFLRSFFLFVKSFCKGRLVFEIFTEVNLVRILVDNRG